MENNFKVLIYVGNFVDMGALNDGIYTTNRPQLYPKDMTLDSLIQQSEEAQKNWGKGFISDIYLENLRKCELVEYKLVKV